MAQWNSAAFEDLIFGCGGVRDLAEIVVLHIQRMLPTADSPVTVDKTIYHLFAVVCIVDPGAVPGHRRRPDPTIQNAFRSCGIVTALTTASRALGKSPLDTAGIVLRSFLFALLDHVASFPPLWLTDSLRAGLLDVVFSSYHREAISVPLRRLLEEVLIPAAVYHSVLLELRIPLAQVRDRAAAKIFGDTVLLAHWKNFVDLAESRFQIFDEYNNGLLMATRACDDVACDKTCPKQELKRCSGCLAAYYCSPKCQTNDWERGGHRRMCEELSSRRKRDYSGNSARDRSFLRALLYREYTTRQAEIAQKRLLFLRHFPREIPCTIFDFTVSGCEIAVVPLKGLRYLGMFQSEVEQRIRSAGTMDLNLMKVIYDDGEPRVWPFPVRVRNVEVEDGQKAMVAGLDELD
ncbi:hypothetical protein C8R45DRAFT_383191 [Mycena sanguinolenta]|nr:hypothetical protein C8R45DRAFT_383191 [Mycena sanguinolenta]